MRVAFAAAAAMFVSAPVSAAVYTIDVTADLQQLEPVAVGSVTSLPAPFIAQAGDSINLTVTFNQPFNLRLGLNVLGVVLNRSPYVSGTADYEFLGDVAGVIRTEPILYNRAIAIQSNFAVYTADRIATGLTATFTYPAGPDLEVSSVQVQIAVIPEPASWAMMIAGFGMAGATLRRRGSERRAIV